MLVFCISKIKHWCKTLKWDCSFKPKHFLKCELLSSWYAEKGLKHESIVENNQLRDWKWHTVSQIGQCQKKLHAIWMSGADCYPWHKSWPNGRNMFTEEEKCQLQERKRHLERKDIKTWFNTLTSLFLYWHFVLIRLNCKSLFTYIQPKNHLYTPTEQNR